MIFLLLIILMILMKINVYEINAMRLMFFEKVILKMSSLREEF